MEENKDEEKKDSEDDDTEDEIESDTEQQPSMVKTKVLDPKLLGNILDSDMSQRAIDKVQQKVMSVWFPRSFKNLESDGEVKHCMLNLLVAWSNTVEESSTE